MSLDHADSEENDGIESDFTSDVDIKKLFERILAGDDWTDKVVSGLKRLRSAFRKPVKDAPLPNELRQLIPDMHAVEKAYVEMTTGFRDFIRAVWEAQKRNKWQE